MNSSRLCQLEVVDRVLFVKLSGVWTKAVVEEVYQQVQDLVKDIQSEPWAAYVDMRHWVMPTLDAFEAFQQIYDWCAANNQTHEATVCKFDTQKRLIGDFSSYPPEYHFFTQKPEEAVQWLNQKGFGGTLPETY